MSRRTKTLLPTTAKLLAPRVVENHHQEIVKGQERQAKYYNRGAKDLPRLRKEDKVRIQDHGQGLKKCPSVKATVKAEVSIRSYEVETQDGRDDIEVTSEKQQKMKMMKLMRHLKQKFTQTKIENRTRLKKGSQNKR